MARLEQFVANLDESGLVDALWRSSELSPTSMRSMVPAPRPRYGSGLDILSSKGL